jgi:hypothetical protein
LKNIKEESQNKVNELTSANQAQREINAKLTEEMTETSQKYQSQIQGYLDDMDQNKRFIALLRDKIRILQDEKNSLGDARPHSTKSPRISNEIYDM